MAARNWMLVLVAAAFGAGFAYACRRAPSQDGFKLVAPATARAGDEVGLAVTGSFGSGDAIVWMANNGRIEGSGPSAKLVPAQPGRTSVSCKLTLADGRTEMLSAEIEISGTAGETASTGPGAPAAPAPAPALGPRVDLVAAGFVPSGFMGEAQPDEPGEVRVDQAERGRFHSAPTCTRIEYKPAAPGASFKVERNRGWAAVAWQFPELNRGSVPGLDMRRPGYRTVSVWVRGEPDLSLNPPLLPTIAIKAGGHTDPGARHAASFAAVESGFRPLEAEWQELTLDLTGRDLSNVVTGFVVLIRASDVGANGATFYVDDITYR